MNSKDTRDYFVDRWTAPLEYYDREVMKRHLDLLLAEHAAKQRQICGDAVSDALDDLNLSLNDKGMVVDACLNATGESDEIQDMADTLMQKMTPLPEMDNDK